MQQACQLVCDFGYLSILLVTYNLAHGSVLCIFLVVCLCFLIS